MMRKKVKNGILRYNLGMRRKKILGYKRMNKGVEWEEKRGKKIIEEGNGVVEKDGWRNGYGKKKLISKENGYVKS